MNNPQQFALQPQFTFEQLYFKDTGLPADSGGVEGGDLQSPNRRAELFLAHLQSEDNLYSPDVVGGDASLHGRKHENLHPDRVSLLFGPEFLEQLVDLPEGQWSGVVRSAYGAHLVYMTQRDSGGVEPLQLVDRKIRIRLSRLRRDEYLAERIGELQRQYHIVVPEKYAEYM